MIGSAIPTATYRLQLHKGFTFADAEHVVPYIAALSVSHLYLSPIQKARAGSLHGYDVVDHATISPELGGEAGLRRLAEAARGAGLGIILDIVPNHMAIGEENAQWMDVLARGQISPWAAMFDIEFDGRGREGVHKIILPILGQRYWDCVLNGEIAVHASGDGAFLSYGSHRLPLSVESRANFDQRFDGVPAADRLALRARDLHALLEQQHYRLCWWRTAGDVINWRRFFDINELVGLRVEDDMVFDMVHDLIFGLYAEGVIDGVRADHVDGLADPAAYLQKLHGRLVQLTAQRPARSRVDGPYIVVEKILGTEEALPEAWPVAGTTGYDFMDEVSAVQHDPAGEAALNSLWREVSNRYGDFDEVEAAARLEVLRGSFAGQLAACAGAFAELARQDITSCDLAEESFRRVLAALMGQLRVYRSYCTGRPDGPALHPSYAASLQAVENLLPADLATVTFLRETLAGQGPAPIAAREDVVRKLNQLSAPVAAKAVEDTAFYRYGRLLSRNDVGFAAGRFALDAEAFLHRGGMRARHWPRGMITTATHDHKRGEDARARLAVLSEIPEEWQTAVRQWLALTGNDRAAVIAADDAYTLFQTLVAIWPVDLAVNDRKGLTALKERVAGWRRKSLREAKIRSSWAAPDEEYERANLHWLDRLLDPEKSLPFLESMHAFVLRVAPAGAVNAVVQAAIRCVWPGMPDLYQGCEFWDLSLVDPDNRRPVDYGSRAVALSAGIWDWENGSVKQGAIARLLALRRENQALFREGGVESVAVRGKRARHVLAFERRHAADWFVTSVLLHVAAAVRTVGEMPTAAWWEDTEIKLPDGWVNAAGLFDRFPVFWVSGRGIAFAAA